MHLIPPISTIILVTLISLGALYFSFRRSNTATDAHDLNIRQENDRIIKIKSSLIQAYRYILEPIKDSERLLIANISISNFSATEVTISLKLEIEFITNDGATRLLQIDHDNNNLAKLKSKNLKLFSNAARLKSNDTITGWCIFNVPLFDDFKSIEEYTIKIKRDEKTLSRVDFYLVKDIYNYE